MSDLKLRDKDVFPTNEVLEPILGESFSAFRKLNDIFSLNELVPEWNYYRDGHAWMCKILSKKKNLGWLNVYDGYFIVTCYFTEKHLDKIASLEISENIKENFYKAKASGRLIPMSITLNNGQLPKDISTILLFKKGLK